MKLFRWLNCINWPFITKKKLRQIESKYFGELRQLRERHQIELDEERDKIGDLLKRFSHLYIKGDVTNCNYAVRCSYELDPRMVHDMFVQGNDRDMFNYIAFHISRMIERELHTVNFVRFNDWKQIF